MIKEARKTSMDPAQERLRQAKAVWNKDVSAFLNDVIHLKKLMNGWPSKFFKERSKIGDPIPADPATILGALAGDFQELAQRGNAIVQQQVQYSQNRLKKRKDQAVSTLDKLQQQQGPETVPPPAAQPTGDDLSKQLAAWEQKYELVALGSNPLSRFWARMKTPRSGFGQAAQLRRLRRDMLDASLKAFRALSKVQVYATKSSKQSVVDAHKHMKVAWDAWSQVSRSYNLLVNSMGNQPFRPEEMKDETPGVDPNLPVAPKIFHYKFRAEAVIDAKNFLKACKDNMIQCLDVKTDHIMMNKRPIGGVEVSFKSPANLDTIKNVMSSIVDGHVMYETVNYLPSYTGVRTYSSPSVQPKEPVVPVPPKEMKIVEPNSGPPMKLVDTIPPAKASMELEVVAQAFLQKWIGKNRHQIFPGKSSGVRLQVYELSSTIRRDINATMDLLEKGLDYDQLGKKISQVSSAMNTLRSLMRSLFNVDRPPTKNMPPMEGMF